MYPAIQKNILEISIISSVEAPGKLDFVHFVIPTIRF